MLSDDLLELQRIDSTIDQLTHRRANLPERAAATTANAELRRTAGRITAMIERQRQLADAVEQAEAAGRQLTQHKERLQAQLKTVYAPREAEALMHELETLAARQDELDDAELANLEEQSQVVDDLTEAHRLERDQSAGAEEATAALAAAEAVIDQQVADLTVERADAAARLDGGALSDYEFRRARLDGVAVARLDGRRCTGCHLDLSTAELEAVRATPAGGFTDCPQCGRMLVP